MPQEFVLTKAQKSDTLMLRLKINSKVFQLKNIENQAARECFFEIQSDKSMLVNISEFIEINREL